MLKKMILTGLALICAAATGAGARAAVDHGGFSREMFSGVTPAALQDPSDRDAAALTAVEPAAGGGNPFTAVLEDERKPARHARGADEQNAAAEKTRRPSGVNQP